MSFKEYIKEDNLDEGGKSLLDVAISNIPNIKKQLEKASKKNNWDEIQRIIEKSLIPIANQIKDEAYKEQRKQIKKHLQHMGDL